MNAVLTTNTTDHWVEVLETAGAPCGPVYDYGQMFSDPQVRHRGLVQFASDPKLGEVPHIRTPVRIGEGVRVRNVAPKLGHHNEKICGRLGTSEAELREYAPRAYCEPLAWLLRAESGHSRRCLPSDAPGV